jgi:cytochrome c biogenesis protein
LTLAILGLLGGAIAYAYLARELATWVLALPFLLFAVNLAAAIATHAVFRRQTALLCFHLALIALVLLIAASRLTYLKGHLELTEGEWFDGTLTQFEAGPWHWGDLDRVRFSNQGFSIEYAPGVHRGPTRNLMTYVDAHGSAHRVSIGDSDPLIVRGYRFYTSFNKGFAPMFSWRATGSEDWHRGSIHLPAYPLHEYRQALEWTPPGSTLALWTMLQIDETLIDPSRSFQFRVPERHRLIVRVGELRHELAPGEQIELMQGTLRYEGLRTWMGYRVFYDWTIPWMLAAACAGVISLAAHFWKKFSAQPWDRTGGSA